MLHRHDLPDIRWTIFIRHFDINNLIDHDTHFVQSLGLRNGARKLSRIKTVSAVVLEHVALYDSNDHLVGSPAASI